MSKSAKLLKTVRHLLSCHYIIWWCELTDSKHNYQIHMFSIRVFFSSAESNLRCIVQVAIVNLHAVGLQHYHWQTCLELEQFLLLTQQFTALELTSWIHHFRSQKCDPKLSSKM